MGFLTRKKRFTPTKVAEVRAMRPSTNPEGTQYEARLRISLEDGQDLDLIFDMHQLKILSVNAYQVAKMMNIEVTNPIAEKAAIWWGMGN